MTLPEFIGPLSLCPSTMKEDYDDIQTFTDYVTGDKAARDKLKAELAGDYDGGDPKKKKNKKKNK